MARGQQGQKIVELRIKSRVCSGTWINKERDLNRACLSAIGSEPSENVFLMGQGRNTTWKGGLSWGPNMQKNRKEGIGKRIKKGQDHNSSMNLLGLWHL